MKAFDSTSGNKYEVGVYIGNFVHGKREGQGTMVWSDGSTFRGTWNNNLRKHGTMIFTNGQVYVGNFTNDMIQGDNEMLLTPGQPIFQGQFND